MAGADNSNSTASSRGRGGRGKGRGRRGGGRGGANGGGRAQSGVPSQSTAAPAAPEQPTTTPAAAPRPAKPESRADGNNNNSNSGGDDDDVEVCFICANPVEYTSIAPCNHKSCHLCALRMRALYGNKDCPHCRVVFTRNHHKNFEDFPPGSIELEDKRIGILYASADMSNDTVFYLKYNCPDRTCDFQGLGWPDLHRHVRSAHRKRICDLCSRNKKLFTHEHALFTDKELEVHMTRGDDQPGAVDQTGFKGHPRCDFCRERYYDADKLYEHCRNRHERCFLCDRDSPATPHYYRNYDDLENHFRRDHFLCPDGECLEKKFVVFASQMDLKAHQLEEHGSSLSNDVRRDARVVDMRNFDYRRSYQPPPRRGGARGRDPNADAPLPASSAQPLRRDELAFQRQLAIHTAQNVAPRSFGGRLTQPSATTPAGPSRAAPSPARQQQPRPPLPQPPQSQNTLQDAMGNDVGQVADPSSLTPQERARLVRHGAVVERASNMLGNDASKIAVFRSHVSSYQRGAFTADQLLNALFALLADASSTAVGTLVKEVADLFEDKDKQEGLLKAWRDWRAINEDYPSLPAPVGQGSTGASSGWAAITASQPSLSAPGSNGTNHREASKLKSATRKGGKAHNLASIISSGASSSPSLSSSSSSRPLATSQSAFPSLPQSKPPAAAGAGKPSWTASSAQNKPNPAKVSINSKEAFPSLPAAPKPQSSILGYGSRVVRRDFGVKEDTGFSWGASGDRQQDAKEEDEEQKEAAGKGKKKGKKVLLQWG